MAYRLKISNQQFETEVEGSGAWTRTVTRDFNDRLFRTVGGYEFTGHRGLYNLLYNHLTINGVCEALTARIYFDTGTGWDHEWTGEIKPQDGEFDLIRRSVATQVLDNSWAAKFNNSDEQKVFLEGQTTKDGNKITACPSELCTLYDPITGAYSYSNRRCYNVYSVFEHLCGYYTDNTVTFVSDFFNTGGDGEQYYITTGTEIRTGDGVGNPEVSFKTLFDEMNKKFNLFIIIEGTPSDPVLRVEPYEYLFKNVKLLDIVDPEQIVMSTDLDQLYTIIEVGGIAEEFDPGNDADYITPRFYAWNDESYNIGGACEFENNTLNLVSDWKIDTNSIQKQLSFVGQDQGDLDSDIFIIEIDPTNQNAFQFTTEFTSARIQYTYNLNLNNENTIIRWFNGITAQILKAISRDFRVDVNTPATNFPLTPSGYPFTSTAGGSDPFGFAVEDSDISDIYSLNLTGGYQSGDWQPGQNGLFDFNGYVVVNTNTGSSVVTLQPVIRVYDDDVYTNIVVEYYMDQVTVPFNGRIDIVQDNVWIPEGGIARIEMDTAAIGLVYFTQAEMNFVTADVNYNAVPDNPLIYNYDIGQHKLSRDDFNTIDQGLGFVRIIDTNARKKYDVYCKSVKYNGERAVIESGEFIGGRPPTELCWILQDGAWDDNCYWIDSEYWNG